ncbi:hypothetical protein [Corynebacterium liangguodongii]|uniref:Uncharacterized protein n=1 Tax=Corynebacterium liangguodongii TaxID=2079535 RepID=A0A2S0WEX9_9CORY|nr:hypothetical protein [Corynebacterium liangguodongii]AWB84319.1 hypothetical protein C3E79_07360 [Corynebacterium liangguodongii]PWB99809.1 hypothetical protein DF219_03955 [Corynebacterium liangguodongii]
MSELSTTKPRPPRRASAAGAGAGLLVYALVAGCIVGAAWGLLRPAYVGTYHDGGFLLDTEASPPGVEFASYGWFVLLSAALGLSIAALAYVRRLTGVGALMWCMVCAGAAAYATSTFGAATASLRHGSAGARGSGPTEGEVLSLVPSLDPGVAWLVGPFVAGLMFYTLALVSAFEGSEGSEGLGGSEGGQPRADAAA